MPSPSSNVDYFLKIEGVEGECQDSKHSGEIAVLSWSWGCSQQGSGAFGGGQGAGKVSMQDFHFTMRLCKASPKLFGACANGTHFPKAVLTCRKAGDKPLEYLKVTFTDCLISSYQSGGSCSHADDIYPTDQLTLNFAKIEFEYCAQKADGSAENPLKAGFDCKKHERV
jgi:type VI secretion system secreted protein Hcp